MKPNIITRCDQAGGKIQHRLGSIRSQEYRSWKYSKAVDLLTAQLKAKKREEELDGTALVNGVSVSPVARIDAEVLSEQIYEYLNRVEAGEEYPERKQAAS